MKKNRIFFVVVAVLFTILGAYIAHWQTSPSIANKSAINQLLTQSFKDTNGHAQSMSQWKGKALLVNFWATWCAPCVDEMPALNALQKENLAAKIQVIGIGIDSAANISQFAAKYKIAYPLYTGGLEATELSRQLGNQAGGLPFTVLVGRDGQIKKSYLGRLKMDELRDDLAAL